MEMNSKQGIAALQKLYGKKAMYRVTPSALAGSEREAAIMSASALRESASSFKQALEERRAAILAADPEYQALKKAEKEEREAYERMRGKAHARRVTVGYAGGGGMFFSVTGEGDNWQQAIDAAKSKASA